MGYLNGHNRGYGQDPEWFGIPGACSGSTALRVLKTANANMENFGLTVTEAIKNGKLPGGDVLVQKAYNYVVATTQMVGSWPAAAIAKAPCAVLRDAQANDQQLRLLASEFEQKTGQKVSLTDLGAPGGLLDSLTGGLFKLALLGLGGYWVYKYIQRSR